MGETHDAANRGSPRPRLCWLVASGAVVMALVVIGIVVVQQGTQLAPANPDYSVTLAPGVRPVTPDGRIAAIARRYLDDQSRVSEGEPPPPVILNATATLARDARSIEPGIPDAQAAAQPDRVVWIVRASGDFLILHDLPWSSQGTPYPSGTIVIDDATAKLLGVYPHAPGT